MGPTVRREGGRLELRRCGARVHDRSVARTITCLALVVLSFGCTRPPSTATLSGAGAPAPREAAVPAPGGSTGGSGSGGGVSGNPGLPATAPRGPAARSAVAAAAAERPVPPTPAPCPMPAPPWTPTARAARARPSATTSRSAPRPRAGRCRTTRADPEGNQGAGSILVDNVMAHGGKCALHAKDFTGDQRNPPSSPRYPQSFGPVMWGRAYVFNTATPSSHSALGEDALP